METTKEIKSEIVKLLSDPGFYDQDESEAAEWIHNWYEKYVRSCCQASLNKAAGKACDIVDSHNLRIRIDATIDDPSNIVLL